MTALERREGRPAPKAAPPERNRHVTDQPGPSVRLAADKIECLSAATTAKGSLQRACLEVLYRFADAGYLPTSSRFVYYDLKQASYPLTHHDRRRDDQDVIDACSYLRQAGVIPWSWIADETRSIDTIHSANSVLQWSVDVLEQARLDPWSDEAPRPVIITESRGVRSVLRATALRYAVPITSCNGQVGGFLHTDVAPRMHPDTPVAYFGDWNPAGESIEGNVRRVLERKIDGDLAWHRLAITADQAEGEGLPPKPAVDNRYKDGRPHDSYEAEALGAGLLIELLASWLDDLIPEPITTVLERESIERERLLRQLRQWQAGDGHV